MKPIDIRQIDESRAADIARLAVSLTEEIILRTGVAHFDVNLEKTTRLCQQFLRQQHYHVLAAFDDERIIGFGALCESHALYAEGTFGILQEFYVEPACRSQHIGRQLLDAIVHFGKSRFWTRLELCTPPLPEFDHTLQFYEHNGFEITGGRKMKKLLL